MARKKKLTKQDSIRDAFSFPGMKVLQYAFDWTEYSYYLPYNHIKNCVVYTGTHDNTTTRAWIEEISDHDRDLARRYIHSENTDYGTFVWDMIREAYRSVADLCIIPMQDYLVGNGGCSRTSFPRISVTAFTNLQSSTEGSPKRMKKRKRLENKPFLCETSSRLYWNKYVKVIS